MPGKKRIDYDGQRFGHLVVVGFNRLERSGRQYVDVICDCGTKKTVIVQNMKTGRTKTCGNCRFTIRRSNPLLRRYPNEHGIWEGMIKRCRSDPNYAGRGIRVCERWKQFEHFIADMGPRPSSDHSIDRIDNNGDYNPDNCRWATQLEQMRNTRKTVFLTAYGLRKPLTWWIPIAGVSRQRMHQRRDAGLSDKEIIFGVAKPP